MSEKLPERVFCTTSEAAEMLGVSVGTVQAWVENGWLDAWKTAGGHRRVLRESVERLLARRTGGATPIPPKVAVPARRPSVMVVDDDVNLLRLYEVRLSRWPRSPHVICVNNAVLALLRIGRSSPDLLIIDLNMPVMDGFTMLHSLRHSPDLGDTSIMVVTGMEPSVIEARGGLPADVDVFGKPVPFDDLQTVWNQLVARSSWGSTIAPDLP